MAGAGAVERAHELYRGGRHREALELYSAALAAARGPAQRIALHSNRAACYLKLHDFHKAAEECTSVLELDREHTGALMLRAQTLVTLKDYQSALFDVSRLIEINPSSEVYRNLQARLKTQLSLAPIPECEEESLYLEEEKEELTPKADQKIETSITKPDQPERLKLNWISRVNLQTYLFPKENLQLNLRRLRFLPPCLQNPRAGRPFRNQRAIQVLITRNGTVLKMIQVKMRMRMKTSCHSISLKSELLACGL
ncbi:unnamed protein product [Urochloa humidicola]